jgi:hypothetical protein
LRRRCSEHLENAAPSATIEMGGIHKLLLSVSHCGASSWPIASPSSSN